MLYDDRQQRPGAKFATADLIGIPWQVLVGPKGLSEGKVEIKKRADDSREREHSGDKLNAHAPHHRRTQFIRGSFLQVYNEAGGLPCVDFPGASGRSVATRGTGHPIAIGVDQGAARHAAALCPGAQIASRTLPGHVTADPLHLNR